MNSINNPTNSQDLHNMHGPYKQVNGRIETISRDELLINTANYCKIGKNSGLRRMEEGVTDEQKILKHRSSKIFLSSLWNDITVPIIDRFEGLPAIIYDESIFFSDTSPFFQKYIPLDPIMFSKFKGKKENPLTTLDKINYYSKNYHKFLEQRVEVFKKPIIEKTKAIGLEEKVLEEYNDVELSYILFQIIRNLHKKYESKSIIDLFGGSTGGAANTILESQANYTPEEFREVLLNTMKSRLRDSTYHADSTKVYNEILSYELDIENKIVIDDKEKFKKAFREIEWEQIKKDTSRIHLGCPMNHIKGEKIGKPALYELMKFELDIFTELYAACESGPEHEFVKKRSGFNVIKQNLYAKDTLLRFSLKKAFD